jgi:hypothetical protein
MSAEKLSIKSDRGSTSNKERLNRDFDLYSYHEKRAGRLVVDPECVFLLFSAKSQLDSFSIQCFREARIELGDEVATKLKLSPDGTKVLWPQPTDSPQDPQNWSDSRKALQLVIITLAAIVPDFDSGIGDFSNFMTGGAAFDILFFELRYSGNLQVGSRL